MIIGVNGRPDSIATLPDILRIEDNALTHPISGEDLTEQTRIALGILKTFNLFDTSITPDMWVMDNTNIHNGAYKIVNVTPSSVINLNKYIIEKLPEGAGGGAE